MKQNHEQLNKVYTEAEVTRILDDIGIIGIGACTGMSKEDVIATSVPMAEYTNGLMQDALAIIDR